MIEQFAKWFFGPDIWQGGLSMIPLIWIALAFIYILYKKGPFQ